MKAMRGFNLFLGLLLVIALSGCAVRARPIVYMPPPPPVCPEGYYWTSGYGCVAIPAPVVVQPEAVYAVSMIRHLSLRSCPSSQCGIIASLGRGEQVQVLGHEGQWTRVWALRRGVEGWVASKYLD